MSNEIKIAEEMRKVLEEARPRKWIYKKGSELFL